MIAIRKAEERGHANHGWLDSHHTFSFADYQDPKHMGFRGLRVINEDRVQPGRGFQTHSHRDMEIISYVLEGGLAHRDSMGTGSTLKPGDVQLMSAGTGVTHSEFNASTESLVHFVQIWLLPAARGITPSYAEKSFAIAERKGQLRRIVSPDGDDGSLKVHADASVYAGVFEQNETASLSLGPGRYCWVQVARGRVRINGNELVAGDAAALSDEQLVQIEGIDAGEVLVFDLG